MQLWAGISAASGLRTGAVGGAGPALSSSLAEQTLHWLPAIAQFNENEKLALIVT